MFITLTWSEPEGAPAGHTTDLDLRLHHPNAGHAWSSSDWVASFANPMPDWGEPGEVDDDPRLSYDRVGAGTETIELARPEEGLRYAVGADARRFPIDGEGEPVGPVWATLGVWLDGEWVFEDVIEMPQPEVIHHVVDIVWCDRLDPACERVQPPEPICEVEGDPLEVCDGLDNDCNGIVDDVEGALRVCTIELGACVSHGVLRCQDDGEVRCDGSPIVLADEVCNARDDDCDGLLDEGVCDP